MAEHWLDRLLELSPDSSVGARRRGSHLSRAQAARARSSASYQRALALAPEDVDTLRALADLHGELGQARRAARAPAARPRARPQDEGRARVRRAHRAPSRAPTRRTPGRPSASLPMRFAPAQRHHRRTLLDLTVTRSTRTASPSSSARSCSSRSPTRPRPPAREYAFSSRPTPARAAPRRARLPRRRQGRRGDRERRGRRRQPGDRDVHLGAAPSTCSSRGSRRATWSSSATASTTWRRATSSPTTSARSSYLQSTEPIAHAEYVLITPEDAAALTSTPARPGPRAERGGDAATERMHTLPRRRRRRRSARAGDAALVRGARLRARLDLQDLGQTSAAGTGASCAISSSSTTRRASSRTEITEGQDHRRARRCEAVYD